MTRVLIIEDTPALGARAKIYLMNAGFEDDEVEFWCVAEADEPDGAGVWKTADKKINYRKLGFLSAMREIETTEAEVGIFDLKLGGHDLDGTGSINQAARDFIRESGDHDLESYLETADFRTISAGLCLIKQFCKDKTRKRGVIVCSNVAVWADSFLDSLGLPVSRSVSLENYTEERIVEEVNRMLESLQSPNRNWFARGDRLAERMPERLVVQMKVKTEGRDPHRWDPDNPDRACWWLADSIAFDWRELAKENGFKLGKNELTFNRLKGVAQGCATSGGLLASLLEVNDQDGQGFLRQLGCSEECRVALRVNGADADSVDVLSRVMGRRSEDRLCAGNGDRLSLRDEARLAFLCLAFGGGHDVRIEATCDKLSGTFIIDGTGYLNHREFVGCFAGRNLRKCDCKEWLERGAPLPRFAVAHSGDLLNTLRDLHEQKGFTVYQLASLPMVGELEDAITVTDGAMWDALVSKATEGKCGGVYAVDLTQKRTRFRLSLIAIGKM